MTRRQPAIAFWASVRIWVAICTGPTNRVTRNGKASTLSGGERAGEPEPDADDDTPALASPAESRPAGRTP